MLVARRSLALVVSAALIACARQQQQTDRPVIASQPARSSDVISAAELADPTLAGDALDAVRRLRPRFLVKRGTQSIKLTEAGTVHVSVDGGPLMALNTLSRFRPAELAEIRYLNSADAAQRFGTSAGSGGVILVRSR